MFNPALTTCASERMKTRRVPDVLLSGNFAQIARWQDEQSLERTRQLRPDLLGE